MVRSAGGRADTTFSASTFTELNISRQLVKAGPHTTSHPDTHSHAFKLPQLIDFTR